MAIDLGDTVRLAFTNLVPAGGGVSVPANPDQVTVTITLPDGTAAAPVTVAPASTGSYQYDYLTTMAGRHSVRWVGTGTNAGAYTDAFDVRPAEPAYILSLADAKAQLDITGTSRDEELRGYLEAVTSVVENHLCQKVARATLVEEHEVSRGGTVVLSWSPVVSLTSVASVDGAQTWDVGSLRVSPAGVVSTLDGMPLSGRVAVTYVAGMQVVPANVTRAALIVLQHVWQSKRGDKGPARPGAMADTAQLGQGRLGFFLPNAAIELLGPGLPGIA